MSSITETGSTLSSAIGASSAASTISENSLGKDDFLQLLVAQLQNQDPLNPADPTEFTAQLAQYSSLEQLFTVNDNLETLTTLSSDMERLSALSLVGRSVVSTGGELRYGGGEAVLGYRLPDAVTGGQLQVLDDRGAAVANISLQELGAGDHFLRWDGVDDSGQVLPPGEYRLAVAARQGEMVYNQGEPLTVGTVNGVDFDPAGSILVTDAGDFRLRDVTEVGRGVL